MTLTKFEWQQQKTVCKNRARRDRYNKADQKPTTLGSLHSQCDTSFKRHLPTQLRHEDHAEWSSSLPPPRSIRSRSFGRDAPAPPPPAAAAAVAGAGGYACRPPPPSPSLSFLRGAFRAAPVLRRTSFGPPDVDAVVSSSQSSSSSSLSSSSSSSPSSNRAPPSSSNPALLSPASISAPSRTRPLAACLLSPRSFFPRIINARIPHPRLTSSGNPLGFAACSSAAVSCARRNRRKKGAK